LVSFGTAYLIYNGVEAIIKEAMIPRLTTKPGTELVLLWGFAFVTFGVCWITIAIRPMIRAWIAYEIMKENARITEGILALDEGS